MLHFPISNIAFHLSIFTNLKSSAALLWHLHHWVSRELFKKLQVWIHSHFQLRFNGAKVIFVKPNVAGNFWSTAVEINENLTNELVASIWLQMKGRMDGRSIYIRCSFLFCKQSLIIAYLIKLSKTLQKETSGAICKPFAEFWKWKPTWYIIGSSAWLKNPVFVEPEVSVLFYKYWPFP